MRVGFFPNMNKEDILTVLKDTYGYCKEFHMEVYVPADVVQDSGFSEESFPADHAIARDAIFSQLDLALSFGGDGTLLQLARESYTYETPICGVNLGELGFLNQIELNQLRERLEKLSKGDYYVEDRIHLQGSIISSKGDKVLEAAINDIVVTRSEPGKMARINLSINEGHTQMYPADGIIISTSTGSTGYNLSAGGPIMAPDNHSMVVTPVAPHLLRGIPLILKESARIDITMPERQKNLFVSIDGTFDYELTNEERLHIEANPIYSKYVRFNDQKFFATLFKKLSARTREGL